MSGRPISELNAAVRQFKEELLADELAAKRVEIAIVTFGPVQVHTDFCNPDTFVPPTLVASGDTPMGAAIQEGLRLLQQRKQTYQSNGVAYYRPWVFLITDGAPTDAWQSAATLVRVGEEQKAFSFFAVAVDQANLQILSQISVRPPIRMAGLQFREFFNWLSNSLGAVAQSQPGQSVQIQKPSDHGWAIEV